MNCYGVTDKGLVRQINQDAFHIGKGVPSYFVVADGMGGHKAGDIAATLSITAVNDYFAQNELLEYEKGAIHNLLTEAVRFANAKVLQKASEDEQFSGMGTTIDLCLIVGHNLYIAHVGDSRVYLLKDGVISQLTCDHSYVTELLQSGKITDSQARNHPQKNIITRAVGTSSDIKIDFLEAELKSGNIILMCTDGLTNMIDDDSIKNVLEKHNDIKSSTHALIDEAKKNGGKDNITAIVIKIGNGG